MAIKQEQFGLKWHKKNSLNKRIVNSYTVMVVTETEDDKIHEVFLTM